MAKIKQISVRVTFDADKFMEKYEPILMAVNDLYDLVPEWKEGLAENARDEIIKQMIAISVDG